MNIQEKEMKTPEGADVLFKDFSPMAPVTGLTLSMIRKFGKKYRGSVRVSTGRIWTQEEYDERRTRVLNRVMP